MIWLLRVAFTGVLLTMLCVIGWASTMLPLWQTPRLLLRREA